MASKSKSRRRVFRASCILAALIVAGSSFAWFTSKDEVTNRLSATADYDVSIVEDFTPPANWIPGQKIDKNVAVVNTGDIDAFVRTWVEGEMNVLSQEKDAAKWNTTDNAFKTPGTNAMTSILANEVNVKDTTLTGMGLTREFTESDETYYLKTLSKLEQDNPTNIDNAHDETQVDGTDATDTSYSEVKSVQAGGYLAYTTTGMKYSFTPNQEIEVKTSDGNTYKVAKGVKVTVDPSAATESSADAPSGTAGFTTKAAYLGDIDSDSFVPATTGLYIFRRNVKYKGDNPENPVNDDYEFSGYYYVAPANDAGGQGTYYALQNQATDEDGSDKQRSDYTLPKDAYQYTADANDRTKLTWAPTEHLALFTAKREQLDNDDLKWYYTAATTGGNAQPAMLHAFYDRNDDAKFDRDDIMIDIALSNISNAPATDGGQTWSVIDTGSDTPTTCTLPGTDGATVGTNANKGWTFYYNDDLEGGDTTARLIDNVTLNENVTNYGYLAFDFDLNVFMDSIQVTIDESGNEGYETVKTGWAATADTTIGHNGVTPAQATTVVGTPEISTINWSNVT